LWIAHVLRQMNPQAFRQSATARVSGGTARSMGQACVLPAKSTEIKLAKNPLPVQLWAKETGLPLTRPLRI
jgi:hypothetical protein